MTALERKNRRLGLLLACLVLAIFAYSFLVIRHLGSVPPPQNLTPVQRILRGL